MAKPEYNVAASLARRTVAATRRAYAVLATATAHVVEPWPDATPAPAADAYYLRPDGVSYYLRPDGVSRYLRP